MKFLNILNCSAFRSASSMFGRTTTNQTTISALSTKEPVPDVMVTFGNPPNHMTFLSHPVDGLSFLGVMAVVKLLEMKYLVTPRASLTQENVDALKEFDSELANKCQLAVDAEIDINFMDLEHIDKPEFLQKYLHEKELLTMARKEVLSSPPGVYRIPYYAREWEKPEVPRKWRPETTITQDILSVEPDLIKDMELQSIVSDYLRKKPIDVEEFEDPIVQAAAETKKKKSHSVEGVKVGSKKQPKAEPHTRKPRTV